MTVDLLKGIEAILFDFEGTLVGSQWSPQGAVRETLGMLKASGFPVEQLQDKKYSLLMNEAIKMAPHMGQSRDEIREKIGAIFDRYDQDALTRWSLRPGARDCLKTLKAKNLRMGLVSNAGRRALEAALIQLDLREFFEVIVTRNDVQFMKPSGEGMNLALSRLDVDKHKTLYVGDTLEDVLASREAGLKVILIAAEEKPSPGAVSVEPDARVRDFGELVDQSGTYGR